ncbi:hypothetical protein B1H19_03455 [Streptomyces gilvosporeus]|uniref:Uncharacterized protein n=1 Tax=Streptomyces gilvosporeus TaxID=553510 RepID=A0A1V0TK89_9ACTN|nr:hypothetical protein B1H19_03455 [Streptomyces gilvosporeus]
MVAVAGLFTRSDRAWLLVEEVVVGEARPAGHERQQVRGAERRKRGVRVLLGRRQGCVCFLAVCREVWSAMQSVMSSVAQ